MTGKPKPGELALYRLFIAIQISASVRARLRAVQEELKRCRAHVGWVAPANMHLSLVFIGDAPRRQVPDICGAIDRAVVSDPFDFTVAGIGHFGGACSPRVLWAGVDAPEALAGLQRRVRENVTAIGLSLETRPYHPHLTLGRVRSSRGKRELLAALEGVRTQSFGDVRAERVCLFRSVLGPGGATYSVLHVVPLAAS